MPKGGKRVGAGRKKGVANRATQEAREAISAFVNKNTPRLNSLLDRIEQENGALEAFKCIQSLIEYHVPKLSRAELQHEGEVTLSTLLADLDEIDEKRDSQDTGAKE